MILPDGWRVVVPPNKKAIYLFKRLPLSYNDIPNSAGITINQEFKDSIYKSFNEVPKDKLEVILVSTLPDLEKEGKAEGAIKDIGIHKVIWYVVSEDKVMLDSNVKSIYTIFRENGYTWTIFAVNVPEEYYDTMNGEMEQLIESFTTI